MSSVRTSGPSPACPSWCRGHTSTGLHTRDLGVWHDDNNLVEIDLFQLDGEPPFVRIFLGESEYTDVTLAGASILGRIMMEMGPDQVAEIGRGLLGASIRGGGAR